MHPQLCVLYKVLFHQNILSADKLRTSRLCYQCISRLPHIRRTYIRFSHRGLFVELSPLYCDRRRHSATHAIHAETRHAQAHNAIIHVP